MSESPQKYPHIYAATSFIGLFLIVPLNLKRKMPRKKWVKAFPQKGTKKLDTGTQAKILDNQKNGWMNYTTILIFSNWVLISRYSS